MFAVAASLFQKIDEVLQAIFFVPENINRPVVFDRLCRIPASFANRLLEQAFSNFIKHSDLKKKAGQPGKKILREFIT